ncbi:PEP-CTERM sorting domain-containing protein [Akkermansiaceae bacterium]|nr:PEP-CTERM sorting domain-containing protein [Akkermansiaceae bacterium]
MSAPAFAGVTVIDFGAIQDNCCGDLAHTLVTTSIEAGDPAAQAMLHPNAGTAQADSGTTLLSDGATLQWTNVSAWNNSDAGVDAAQSYFLHRTVDALATGFTVTTANPGDIVSIDFVGGVDRDALITIGGSGTVVPNGSAAWTNVATGAVGTVTGDLSDNTGDEGNVGAMRITITPVPEPSSSLLLGMSALALGFFRRRK